ncbi:hypothetical protein [Nocardia vaccinii]|uniref:hypothetical protein n=1 Tax=Nocardia vaccinii TaxID=1822 RepID=UPI0012F4A993|nr:hypothetical protein [Nocardia vaccinii]
MIELDIRSFFDSVRWDLVGKTVAAVCDRPQAMCQWPDRLRDADVRSFNDIDSLLITTVEPNRSKHHNEFACGPGLLIHGRYAPVKRRRPVPLGGRPMAPGTRSAHPTGQPDIHPSSRPAIKTSV